MTEVTSATSLVNSANSKPTIIQWDLVCFCEEFWSEHRAFPSYKEIIKNVSGLTTDDEVNAQLYSDPVRVRLKNRGVDYSVALKETDPDFVSPTRLSDKQLAVISTLLNPLDGRSQTKKLASLGVKPATFAGWMRGERFSGFFRARSEELFGDALPLAHESLVRKVADGDIRAIKLFYEVSGRYTGARKEETANLRLILAKLTEIIQHYVSPEIMRQIINDVDAMMIGSGVSPVDVQQTTGLTTGLTNSSVARKTIVGGADI